ncbi:hypothetical protein [Formosa sp. 4Alg 33]|uniref:hypothetical protein n=1 Tax=Formosa sp. 4Alg 33 TaxID=3382189 RepID=UPI003D9C40BE
MDFNQITNRKVLEAYNTLDNFKIIEGDESSDTVYVYFTSNGLYFPNTEEAFEEVLSKDKYEWQHNLVNGARKHILVRDVFKQHYLKGINKDINSIDQLILFIKESCKDYKIVTLGSSSGGYMSMLVGSILNAYKIYSFNGQFDLWFKLETPELELKNPLIYRYKDDKLYNKYYDINPFLKNNKSYLFYFCSILSDQDIYQNSKRKVDSKLFPFYIKSEIHGIPFYKQNLSRVLCSEPDKLKAIASKKHMSQFKFSLKLEGLLNTLKYYRRNNIK